MLLMLPTSLLDRILILAFTWDLHDVFEKSSCFLIDIFDRWMLQLLQTWVMSLTLNLLDSFVKLSSVVMFACFKVLGNSGQKEHLL